MDNLRMQIAERFNRAGNMGINFKATNLQDISLEFADIVLLIVADKMETYHHKPTQYHHLCWASGTVLVLDHWGQDEVYRCPYFNGDFNCGHRRCKTGNVVGNLKLTDIEKYQNWLLDEILRMLRTQVRGKVEK